MTTIAEMQKEIDFLKFQKRQKKLVPVKYDLIELRETGLANFEAGYTQALQDVEKIADDRKIRVNDTDGLCSINLDVIPLGIFKRELKQLQQKQEEKENGKER